MILVTGSTGYIGSVLTRFLHRNGYRVIGLDNDFYRGCEFFSQPSKPVKQIFRDIRDIKEQDLEEVSVILHLAALSNDPLGEINPSLTQNINYSATIRLFRMAKKMGIEKVVFASSCSLYGVSSDNQPLTEEGRLNPVTAYAKSKVKVEEEASKLADRHFHPVFLRNATAYGVSPNLRLDLVVNNLVGSAFLTGKVTVLSDGSPWRPIIHVEDICRAFMAVIEAPVEKIHNQAFNIGINEENYQVKDIAFKVQEAIPHSQIEILNRTGPDERTYRVDFTKIRETLPGFNAAWNLIKGIDELYQAYKQYGLKARDFKSPKYFRVRWLRWLIQNEKVDSDLRWT